MLFRLSFMLVAVSMVQSYTVVRDSTSYGYTYGFNAPVAAPVSRSSSYLGPFFGYFPQMFAAPASTASTTPTTCPPKVCPAAPKESTDLTVCVQGSTSSPLSGASSSPKGTIVPAGGIPVTTKDCNYAITAVDPTQIITITCSDVGAPGNLRLTPDASNKDADGYRTAGKPYQVSGGFVYVSMIASSQNTAPNCAWTIGA